MLEPDKALVLPWPPSANRYWRHTGNRVLVSREAKAYKSLIKGYALLWRRKQLLGRISLHIQAFPPDKRARDIDNLLKISIDSLEGCGLFENDSQIDKICIERMPVREGGELLIWIDEL